MHLIFFQTLEEVNDFYIKVYKIGKGLDVSNQTLPSDKLNLSPSEKKSLISFLNSLESAP